MTFSIPDPAPLAEGETLPDPRGPVLVAGGAGYIGSHCVRLLVDRGVDVVVLDNLSTGHAPLPMLASRGKAVFEQVDLGDPAAVRKVFEQHRPAAVIHFAAKCYVGESVTEPAKYYRENVAYTLELLDVMRSVGCRDIVFSSTCATYGEPIEVPITESHPQSPINPYGMTKLHMEQMIADFARAYDLRFAALRYFNAAGASPEGDMGEHHEPETHLIPLVLQVALGQREKIMMFGEDYPTRDGTCVRDYIHVNDLGDAHLRALARLQGGVGRLVCNLGTGNGYTVKELIDHAREVTGHAIPAEVAPRRAGDPAQLISGGSGARDLLGWSPERSDLRTILEDAWRWHSAHPRGYEG
ncbi:MAG: UDP-glucose 4-epimerase GalE [Planctomycetota bacterium]|jgi:UDP-glucose 4-epimerase